MGWFGSYIWISSSILCTRTSFLYTRGFLVDISCFNMILLCRRPRAQGALRAIIVSTWNTSLGCARLFLSYVRACGPPRFDWLRQYVRSREACSASLSLLDSQTCDLVALRARKSFLFTSGLLEQASSWWSASPVRCFAPPVISASNWHLMCRTRQTPLWPRAGRAYFSLCRVACDPSTLIFGSFYALRAYIRHNIRDRIVVCEQHIRLTSRRIASHLLLVFADVVLSYDSQPTVKTVTCICFVPQQIQPPGFTVVYSSIRLPSS